MKKDMTPREFERTEQFIMVNKLFWDDKYTDYELFIYTLIEGLSRNPFSLTQTGVNQLISLSGMYANTALKTKVKETLEKLRDNEIIIIYNDYLLREKVQEIKPSNAYFIKNNLKEEVYNIDFTKVFYSDFNKITKLQDTSKVKIYRVYYAIVSHIFDGESNSKVAFPNIETISANTGIDRKSVIKYIKVLVDNKILLCAKIRVEAKKDKNYYARLIHQEEFVATINEMRNKYGGTVHRIWEDTTV